MTEAEAVFAKFGHHFMRYCQESGTFWFNEVAPRGFMTRARTKRWQTVCAGREAGWRMSNGYRCLRCQGKEVLAHRYAWFLHTGEWPPEIDHINGDRSDNRLRNLRAASRSLNMRNARRRSDNRSGETGVRFSKHKKCWVAEICVNKKRLWLGAFKTKADAVAARRAAEKSNGFGPNHGSCNNTARNAAEQFPASPPISTRGAGAVSLLGAAPASVSNSFHSSTDSQERQDNHAD